jgi:hypothetical protein
MLNTRGGGRAVTVFVALHEQGPDGDTHPGGRQVTIFIVVDHCSAECIGIHADKQGTRFETLEPIRQGVSTAFGAFGQEIAQGLVLRHDHGSQ